MEETIAERAAFCVVLSENFPVRLAAIHISPLLGLALGSAIPNEANVDGARGYPPIVLA